MLFQLLNRNVPQLAYFSYNFSFEWLISWIMCSLRTPRPICRSTSRPTYRSIRRSTYRSMLGRYVGWDVGRHIGRGVSVEHWSICRPTYRPVYRPICRPMLDRYVGRYSGRPSADTLTVDYRRNIGRVSVVYQSTVGGLSVDCLII